jgi:hypothetical protein
MPTTRIRIKDGIRPATRTEYHIVEKFAHIAPFVRLAVATSIESPQRESSRFFP